MRVPKICRELNRLVGYLGYLPGSYGPESKAGIFRMMNYGTRGGRRAPPPYSCRKDPVSNECRRLGHAWKL